MTDLTLPERAQQAIAECRRIATMSEEPGRTTRRFLTPPVREVHTHLRSRMESLGMTVQTDAAGNLRGLWQPPGASSAKQLILGSHSDTVPNAGAFDGVLGVTLALEWAQLAQELKLPLAIEIIAFSEEEGVRFGVPFLGSRAVAGRFDPALLALKDADGITLGESIREFGLDPGLIGDAALDPDALGFVEMHIEQGPILESERLSVAAVTGIVGQSRLTLEFRGQANHSGTTPMHLRHDSIAAAAEWISAVERLAQSTPGLVATVGKIEAKPGATNVIAGEALLTLDVRHSSNEVGIRALDELIRRSEEISQRRGLSVRRNVLLNQQGVAMDPFLVDQIEEAIRRSGCEPHRMASGAGHDAMILAEKVPAAMIFLRTPGGISHDPAESVALEDVEKAIDCGVHLLRRLASSSEFLKRT